MSTPKTLPLAAVLLLAGAASHAQQAPTTIEELWEIVQQQQAEIDELRAALGEAREAVAATTDRIEETEARVDATGDYVETLAAADSGASDTSIGGYGEALLQLYEKVRDLALFNLAIDSKLRSCDLVALRVSDVTVAGSVRQRAVIVQQKTRHPVQFELTEQTREAVLAWIRLRSLDTSEYLFPSGIHRLPHLSTRQYARIVNQWVASIGLDPHKYGTHSHAD